MSLISHSFLSTHIKLIIELKVRLLKLGYAYEVQTRTHVGLDAGKLKNVLTHILGKKWKNVFSYFNLFKSNHN